MTANERPLTDDSVRDFYARLLHLLEFTRDMDRNTYDSEFTARDNTVIHYVFDENIFEFFIGARDQGRESATTPPIYSDKRRYSAQFHLQVWRDRPHDRRKEGLWIRVNRQIAAVTAEYLFGGQLPGQFEGRIYMTEWHWNELLHRSEVLHEHFRVKAHNASTKGEPIDALFRSIQSVHNISEAGTVTVGELLEQIGAQLSSSDKKVLLDDIGLLKHSNVNEPSLLRFVTARLIAAILIDDDILEPIQQIRRIFSREFANRLRPLHLLSPRPDRNSRNALGAAAAEWERLIRFEEDYRGVEPERRRNSRRVAVDAQSLAYVQWFADRLERNANERIVFVSGDSLLFDAYRRWWSAKPNRPFALRRVAQYAPLMNFKDAKSSVAFDDDIFGNTRRAIEPALLYFNLAERVDLERPDQQDPRSLGDTIVSTNIKEAVEQADFIRRHGGREHFALLLKLRDPLSSNAFRLFAQRVGSEVIEERQQEYIKIRDAWQELERLSIGVNYQLIEKRLKDGERKQLLSILSDSATADGPGLEGYINQRLDYVYSQSAALFVPATFSALRNWLGSHSVRRFTRRVPIALRLHAPPAVAVDPAPKNVSRIVDELISLSSRESGTEVSDTVYALESESWLAERPELLFAVAATMALRLALWDQATFYARLAVGSDSAKKILGRKDDNERADYFELLYLRAVSVRFQMGDISLVDTEGESRARHLLNTALGDLEACIEYHVNSTQHGSPHILRGLRDRSERAAVRLFFISYLLRTQSQTAESFEEIVEHMILAYDDLWAGRETFPAASERAAKLDALFASAEYTEFYASIRRQILHNLAAWYVFRNILQRRNGELVERVAFDPTTFSRVRDELVELNKDASPSSLPAGIAADIYAFLWLKDEDEVALRTLVALPPVVSSVSLRLDAEVVELYKRELIRDKLT